MPSPGPAPLPTEIHCLLAERPIRIYPVGELDLACKDQLDAAIETVAAGPAADVVVDLSATTFLDSTGLGFLVRLSRRIAAGGHELTIAAPTRPALRAIELSGLDHVLTIA
jgi:anti-sigma B factor antagonist